MGNNRNAEFHMRGRPRSRVSRCRILPFAVMLLTALTVHPNATRAASSDQPPEDMSHPPAPSAQPVAGFDGPCDSPAKPLMCAYKTHLGCLQSTKKSLCDLVGAPLITSADRPPTPDSTPTYYDRAWTLPLADAAGFYGYEFVGFLRADAERLKTLDAEDRARLLNTFELRSQTHDPETPQAYKNSVFFREMYDGSWRYVDSISWTFGPSGTVICNGDPTCGDPLSALEPW